MDSHKCLQLFSAHAGNTHPTRKSATSSLFNHTNVALFFSDTCTIVPLTMYVRPRIIEEYVTSVQGSVNCTPTQHSKILKRAYLLKDLHHLVLAEVVRKVRHIQLRVFDVLARWSCHAHLNNGTGPVLLKAYSCTVTTLQTNDIRKISNYCTGESTHDNKTNTVASRLLSSAYVAFLSILRIIQHRPMQFERTECILFAHSR